MEFFAYAKRLCFAQCGSSRANTRRLCERSSGNAAQGRRSARSRSRMEISQRRIFVVGKLLPHELYRPAGPYRCVERRRCELANERRQKLSHRCGTGSDGSVVSEIYSRRKPYAESE